MQLAVQMVGETTAVLIVVGGDEIFCISAGDSEPGLSTPPPSTISRTTKRKPDSGVVERCPLRFIGPR